MTITMLMAILWALGANTMPMSTSEQPSSAKSMPRDDYQSKLATAQIQMPRESAGAKVQPMNAMERFLLPENVAAVTWPWGRIGMHQGRIEGAGLDPGDVMAHELTHIGQQQKEGALRTMLRALTSNQEYLARPHEQEALQAEVMRPVRRTDINLPDPNAAVRASLKAKVHGR